MESKISVAMATFNGDRYVCEQLESILKQTFPPFEIIISDDCSTDNTSKILHEYAKKYDQITLLEQTCNIGVNNNFIKASEHCTGDYIAFSDQDDVWAQDKLEAILAAIKIDRKKVELAYGKSIIIDKNGVKQNVNEEDFLRFKKYRSGRVPFSFIYTNCVSGHSLVVSKDLLKHSFPIEGNTLYDHWLALIASAKSSVLYVPNSITYHRIHGENATNDIVKNSTLKKKRVKSRKYSRYIYERITILARINKILAADSFLKEDERQFFQLLNDEILKSDNLFFNTKLVFPLFKKRDELFNSNSLKEIRNRSIGGKYYRLIDMLKSLV